MTPERSTNLVDWEVVGSGRVPVAGRVEIDVARDAGAPVEFFRFKLEE